MNDNLHTPAGDLSSASGDYSTAIEAGSFGDAQRVVKVALTAGASGSEIFDHVITPAMYRIGERWERGEINVADEHLATAISNRVMGTVYESLVTEMPVSKERVLIAAVEGDQHVMGLRMVADVLEGAGYETLYLGETPLADLLPFISTHAPQVIALGATGPWSAPRLLDTVRAIRSNMPSLPIVLGGAQAKELADLTRDDHIYVATDATSAVEIIASLIQPADIG
jgi:MerR family transcriptional regulator, light-induced transcriptional regulator